MIRAGTVRHVEVLRRLAQDHLSQSLENTLTRSFQIFQILSVLKGKFSYDKKCRAQIDNNKSVYFISFYCFTVF